MRPPRTPRDDACVLSQQPPLPARRRDIFPVPRAAMIRRLLALALTLASAAGAQPVSKDAPAHTIGLRRDPQLAAVLAVVRPARLRFTDSMLVSFGTRNTFSDTVSQ